MARFVSFKCPFEEVMHPVIFEEIEETTDITKRPEFRCIAKRQYELLLEGLEANEDGEESFIIGQRKYIGNKWGGKYLRAPDIYFTILDRARRYKCFIYKGEPVVVEDVTDLLED